MLSRGGNAVDAAIAIVAAQGVVAPETCGLGGDLFALVHDPGMDAPAALNASGRAGSGADPEILRRGGHDAIPIDHQLAVTVPGCVDGLEALADRFGSWSLGAALEPAMSLAVEGFRVSKEQARAFHAMADTYARSPAVAGFFVDGSPVDEGDIVSRPDLARTLAEIGKGGRSAFYEGVAGTDIADALHPYVTKEDLAREQFEWVEPIGRQIGEDIAWTIPPNSAGYLGPATLAVFLMLEPPDDQDDPLWWHLLIEAHRSLAWERSAIVSEPASLDVEADSLMSDATIERAAAGVSRQHAGTWPTPASTPTGTAYMCVADDSGMAVSIINSKYRGLGSPFGASRSGFLLHDRGSGFNLTPGHSNELGPGKRPAHTLSPTIWTRGDRTSWLLGTRGGELQPQLIAQLAARAITGGRALDDAQDAPRWAMTRYGPNDKSMVSLEPGTGVARDLERLGHEVDELDATQPGWGPMSIVDLRGEPALTARDPRVDTTRAFALADG